MMPNWNILHLSDFHLDNPKGCDEVLRDDHYEEYIADLFQALAQAGVASLDCIAITGDFVDRGSWSEVKRTTLLNIVTRLCESARVQPRQVVMCPGNHDIDREAERRGDFPSARVAYNRLLQGYDHCAHIAAADDGRAALYHLGDRLWVLSVDATLGGQPPDFEPGSWIKRSREDELLRWVKQYLKKVPDELLLVLTHYPVEELQGSLVPDEEPNFHARHIWTKGRQLAARIGNWRGNFGGKTLWLSGDIHVPHRASAHNIDFVTAGRFGCRPQGDTLQPRQAKVIQVYGDTTRTKIYTFNYEMPGYRDRPAGGKWTFKTDVFPLGRGRRMGKNAPLRTVLPTVASPKAASNHVVETIDIELERQLIEKIVARRLYALGRFETHNDEVALGWVKVGRLLDSAGLFSGTLKAMNRWLTDRLDILHDSNAFAHTLLIGLDCWGAIFASQLSVLNRAPNLCVACRGGGLPYTIHEGISDSVLAQVRKARHAVLIQDVVGSGRSIASIYEKIRKGLTDEELGRINWIALSIISDNTRDRSESCGFLAAHGTACGALRMPTILPKQLPPHEVCPPQVVFQV